jgi:hypothetical protein
VLVWSHLSFVPLCALASYLDRHGMYTGFWGLTYNILAPLVVSSLLVWPVFVIAAISSEQPPFRGRGFAILAEIVIWIGQFIAALPLIP